MNLNGKHHNGVMGKLLACREHIQVVNQRAYTSDAARWLLAPVNPEQNASSLIPFVTALDGWAHSLDQNTCEKWLVWALKSQPDTAKKWMGYKDNWTMMPAAVARDYKSAKRVYNENGLPELYLLPGEPRDKDNAQTIVLDNGWGAVGVQLKTATYAQFEGGWFRVHMPKKPSTSAITRAIRLFVTGVLVGREVFTSNDLMMYELIAIRDWMLYGPERNEERLHPSASAALNALVAKPEIASQLPS